MSTENKVKYLEMYLDKIINMEKLRKSNKITFRY